MRRGKMALTMFLLMFYMFIMMYVFFAIIHIDALDNFIMAMLFEAVGFCILMGSIWNAFFSKSMKLGFRVPMLITTVGYTVLLNLINCIGIAAVNSQYFILLHIALLFLYCLVTIPIYVVGKTH